jgi:hypothetical protein
MVPTRSIGKGERPSMDANRSAETRLTPDAGEFVRFCYRRRAVGWPEIYDEMCAVASRGLFRGWGPTELAEHGIGFGLFDLPALAALTGRIVVEEQANRPIGATSKRTTVRLVADAEPGPGPGAGTEEVGPAAEGGAPPHLVSLAS